MLSNPAQPHNEDKIRSVIILNSAYIYIVHLENKCNMQELVLISSMKGNNSNLICNLRHTVSEAKEV